MKQIFLLSFFILVFAGFISYSVTHAFFTNAATSINNTFTAASVFPTPTFIPTPTPIPVNAGDVIINEIYWTGSEGHGTDEWIELLNTTNHTINLSNWVVENLGDTQNPNIIIPSGKIIASHGFFLISHFDQNSASSHLNVASDVISTSVELSNSGELLNLKTSTISGVLIDSANQNGGGWLKGSVSTPKSSMERNTIITSGALAGSWHTASSSANLDAGATEHATPKTVND